jgi:BlaI family transcriptional regulator, penicillinase repressor
VSDLQVVQGPGALSPGQIEVMNVVWDRGKATVAEVWESLSARRKIARNTVQTVMTRLEEKGWLGHEEHGSAFVYFPRRRREATLRSMVANLVDTAFAGSADSLVMALVEGRGVSDAEAARIREVITRAERAEP